MQRLAEPAQATVTDYADIGLSLQLRDHYGRCVPGSCCLACADYFKAKARLVARSQKRTPRTAPRPETGWHLGPEYTEHKRRCQP